MSTSEVSTQSAAERKAAEAELGKLIDKFTPNQVKLIGSMRKSLLKRLPTAHEVVYEYRDCFVISYSPSEQGYEGVLAIRGSAEAVRLYFTHGKDLPDPEKLLQGKSQTRFVDVEGPSTLTRPAVQSLIEEAIARNKVPFASAGRGNVVLRSVGAKKTPAKKAPAKKSSAKKPSRSRSA